MRLSAIFSLWDQALTKARITRQCNLADRQIRVRLRRGVNADIREQQIRNHHHLLAIAEGDDPMLDRSFEPTYSVLITKGKLSTNDYQIMRQHYFQAMSDALEIYNSTCKTKGRVIELMQHNQYLDYPLMTKRGK